ncbi:hypothetical protein ACLOJK_022466, partial [Asimina triloba]
GDGFFFRSALSILMVFTSIPLDLLPYCCSDLEKRKHRRIWVALNLLLLEDEEDCCHGLDGEKAVSDDRRRWIQTPLI